MKRIIVKVLLSTILIFSINNFSYSQVYGLGCNQYDGNHLIVELDGQLNSTDEGLIFGNFGGTVINELAITPNNISESIYIFLVEFNFSESPFSSIEQAHSYYECNGGINSSTGSQRKVRATDLNYLISSPTPSQGSASGSYIYNPLTYNPYFNCPALYSPIVTQVAESNVKIGVVDSGQDENSSFQEFISYTDAWDFVDDDSSPDDVTLSQHGTNVNAIIGGMLVNNEPSFSITPIKILDEQGTATLWQLYQGVGHAINIKMNIINLSVEAAICQQDQCTVIFEDILSTAKLAKILVSAAAGNSTQDVNNNYYIPASCEGTNLLVTGSSSCNDQISEFSNYGSLNVDLFTPGENINGYTSIISGTSFAAPQTTATAAAIGMKMEEFHYSCAVGDIFGTIIPKNWDAYCVSGGVLNIIDAIDNDCPIPIHRANQNNNQLDIKTAKNIKHTSSISNNYFASSDQLIINIQSSTEQKGVVNIFSITGQLVSNKSYSLSEGENQMELNGIQNLPKGIYIVSVTMDQKTISQKCFKQ